MTYHSSPVTLRPSSPLPMKAAVPRDHGGGDASFRRRHVSLLGRRRDQEALDRLLAGARAARGQALVIRGEAGIGKTALLDYLVDEASGCTVAWATGVQAETELPFAGLQQLLGTMLAPLERLPDLHREAIEVALGLRAGRRPDRLLLGVAVRGLLVEIAHERPLVCVVDDAHWLDRASAQTLAFVARRLAGEAVAFAVALREPDRDEIFSGLPELVVLGLGDVDARALLGGVIGAPLDVRVLDRLVAESRGNPLALIELPRGLSPAQLAGGFGLPTAWSARGRIEESFRRRLDALPPATRGLLRLAAAEPLGDAALLLRAAERLGLGLEAAAPAEEAALLELGTQVRFRHPLVRSVAYHAAPLAARKAAHLALAEATDPDVDPDRRAWHRAAAAMGPDEDVASELEQTAQRALARGGVAAVAAFLERAAALTPNPDRRAQRALAAAYAHQLAGAPTAALRLLDGVADGPLDQRDKGLAQQVRGRVALHLGRTAEAVPSLLDAAKRLEPVDPGLAREVHLEALYTASVAGRLGPGIGCAANAARAAPPAPCPPRAIDLLLDGLALRFTDGYSASAPVLKRAVEALCDEDGRQKEDMCWPWLAARTAARVPSDADRCWLWLGARTASELFDEDSWHLLASRRVQFLRDIGALSLLPIHLSYLADLRVLEGNLGAATALLEEAEWLIDATGGRRIPAGRLLLAACRGNQGEAEPLIAQAERDAAARGEGMTLTFAGRARAVLCNGLGQYESAVTAAQQTCDQDELSVPTRTLAELVEGSARSGNPDLAAGAIGRLSERTRVAGTESALGIEARSRALMSEGEIAERLYREGIARLRRSRLELELARAHLLYGEWLRREQRRTDAREQLRKALMMFTEMGAGPFAERAGRELVAAGETARRRSIETRDDLTPQELRIARMARDGASNQAIAEQLFVSRKTVEYHLHKVFQKLGISKREQLTRALPRDDTSDQPRTT
jgi:DNA-binding CsgD family transcriptional regulator